MKAGFCINSKPGQEADPKLKLVIDRKYPVYTHGMVEDEEAKKRGEESEAK